jgi:hypothetical protein
MEKRVVFTLSDEDQTRAKKYFSEKHFGYEAARAFEEMLKRREARTRRAERDRKEED